MKKIQLMTHIVAGYPSLRESEKIALAMANAGAKFIEIQIPFSDPIADGKTIADANRQALKNGIAPDDCFALLGRLKKKIMIPILIMTYFNIPFRYGLEKFCKKAAANGCFGLIIPDIPFDEEKNEHYIKFCKKYGLRAIQIVSPITPPRRLKKIGKIADGFVYCVSHAGTTGEKNQLPQHVGQYFKMVRKYIKTPLAIGFGISNRKQVESLSGIADIIVIGSKILNVYNESPKGEKIKNISAFLRELEQVEI